MIEEKLIYLIVSIALGNTGVILFMHFQAIKRLDKVAGCLEPLKLLVTRHDVKIEEIEKKADLAHGRITSLKAAM